MKTNDIQDEIIDEFAQFDEVIDKNEYLIELGNGLPPLEDSVKLEKYLIKGCQSKVWISPELKDGKVHFVGTSDSIFVRGLVALALRVFSEQTPENIIATDLFFPEKIGLHSFITPTRSNGFLAMIKQIKLYAMVFQKLDK